MPSHGFAAPPEVPLPAAEKPDRKLSQPLAFAPMTFKLGRRAGSGDCAKDCAEFIVADGDIMAQTPRHFSNFLKSTGLRQLPLLLNSPGGSVDGALELARLFRAENITVIVARMAATPCDEAKEPCMGPVQIYADKPVAGLCNSACPYALAGGVRRAVMGSSSLGVHQFYKDSYLKKQARNGTGFTFAQVQEAQRISAEIAAHLQHMDVSVDLFVMATQAPPTTMRVLNLADMRRTRLITDDVATLPMAFGTPATPAQSAFLNLQTAAITSAPAPLAKRDEQPLPPPFDTGWSLQTTDGAPVLRAAIENQSRRLGRVAMEIRIGCPVAQTHFPASFRERIIEQDAYHHDAMVMVGARGFNDTLVAANASGDIQGQVHRDNLTQVGDPDILRLQITSAATSGLPIDIEVPGSGLPKGLLALTSACESRKTQN